MHASAPKTSLRSREVHLVLCVVAASALGCGGPSAGSEPVVASSPRATRQVEQNTNEPPRALAAALDGEPVLASRDGSDWVAVGGFDFAFRLPAGWHRVSAERLEANRQRMLGGDVVEALSREAAAWRRSFQVGATAAPLEESVGLVPTIQVNLRPLPREVSAAAVCAAAHQELTRAFPDATLANSDPALLGSVPAHRCVIRYLMVTASGEYPAEAETYFAVQGSLMLQMSFSGPAPLDRDPVNAVLGSIRPLE